MRLTAWGYFKDKYMKDATKKLAACIYPSPGGEWVRVQKQLVLPSYISTLTGVAVIVVGGIHHTAAALSGLRRDCRDCVIRMSTQMVL